MANKLPTLQDFAKLVGVHISTIYGWLEKHEEFLDAFTRARARDKKMVLNRERLRRLSVYKQ